MLLTTAYQYQFYEMAHAALVPARAFSDAAHFLFRNPFNPLSATPFGKNIAAGAELFERMTRRYGKPMFGLDTTDRRRRRRTTCSRKSSGRGRSATCCASSRPTLPGHEAQPKLLIVAPMSGHYATLLRGTVEAFLPTHRVYITDWADARMVPLAARPLRSRRLHRLSPSRCCEHLGPGVHTLGVCQPAVPLHRRGRADGGGRRTRARRRR